MSQLEKDIMHTVAKLIHQMASLMAENALLKSQLEALQAKEKE